MHRLWTPSDRPQTPLWPHQLLLILDKREKIRFGAQEMDAGWCFEFAARQLQWGRQWKYESFGPRSHQAGV